MSPPPTATPARYLVINRREKARSRYRWSGDSPTQDDEEAPSVLLAIRTGSQSQQCVCEQLLATQESDFVFGKKKKKYACVNKPTKIQRLFLMSYISIMTANEPAPFPFFCSLTRPSVSRVQPPHARPPAPLSRERRRPISANVPSRPGTTRAGRFN